jgi:hypothetical protein
MRKHPERLPRCLRYLFGGELSWGGGRRRGFIAAMMGMNGFEIVDSCRFRRVSRNDYVCSTSRDRSLHQKKSYDVNSFPSYSANDDVRLGPEKHFTTVAIYIFLRMVFYCIRWALFTTSLGARIAVVHYNVVCRSMKIFHPGQVSLRKNLVTGNFL